MWLSARSWPTEDLAGAVSITDGHFIVGSAALPGEGETAFASGRSGQGWIFDLFWVLPYLGVLTAIHFLRVIRWQPLLDPIVKLDFKTHNRIGAVGFMAMFLFPLRLGELVRPYLVKQATGRSVRMSEVMATVVVERIVDGLVVSLLLFIVLPFLPVGAEGSARSELLIGAGASLAVFLGATALLAMSVWQHERTERFIKATIGRVSRGLADRICDLLDAFFRGLKALPSFGAFAWFVALTLVYWGINGLGVWMMARAFYLPVDMIGAYAMMACVVVGMMIPNSPGNVGSFWYFLILPLTLYGVSASAPQAVAFGVMVWVFQLIQQTAFGAWYVIRGKVSLSRVVEATRETEASLTAAETAIKA